METSMLVQIIINGLVIGLYYVLIASGFSLIFGIARIFNFAHGDMVMFGAYITYVVVSKINLSYGLGILLGVATVALMGVILNNYVYKPVRRMMYASFMVSIGLGLALPAVALIIFGETERSVPRIFHGTVNLLGATVTMERVAVIIACTFVLIALFLFVSRTRIGKAMRAVAYNPDVAALQGIDVEHICLIAFIAGAVLAGLAGGIVAPLFTVHPVMGGIAIFKAMVVVILGGLGSISGALVAGLALGFIESFGVTLIGYEAHMIGWMMVIILLYFRPWGLLGRELA
jgi:branched-chain amino acid transport system permease protein